jgi:alkylation response protein AidB-like acyl-CoA dehydrogenase
MRVILDEVLQPGPALETALASIAARAGARDAQTEPEFPHDALTQLREAGALGLGAMAGPDRPEAAAELTLVRRVSQADGSVGRIFDGHLNAVERLAVQGPSELIERELDALGRGELLAGVWGGDPIPGEGEPAQVHATSSGPVLRGVKTFCSGAGGLDRALILARGADRAGGAGGAGGPVSTWIDLTDSTVTVDRSWYRSHGLRASVSHRVEFDDTPVLAELGSPGSISAQPWFARDALRTAASWAGMADAAVGGALGELAGRTRRGELESLAAGRILTARRTISSWMETAAQAMDHPGPDLPAVALHGRAAIADACRSLLDEAARACGSHPFAHGGTLDRARRDLEVFLLQHRLDPLLARAGEAALGPRRI